MKKILLISMAFFAYQLTQAQPWLVGTPSTSIYYNGGNVGIGTNVPATSLQVKGVVSVSGGAGSELRGGGSSGVQFVGGYASPVNGRMIFGDNSGWKFHFSTKDASGIISDVVTLLDNGNIGIGTTTPQTLLDLGEMRFGKIASLPAEGSIYEGVWGNYIIGDATTSQRLRLGVSNDGYTRAEIFIDNSNRPDGTLTFKTGNGGAAQSRMFINGDGNVLIGKTSQTNTGYILDVNGATRANKIVVNTTGADFVFEKRYQLMDLPTLEKYIKDNQHLPGIEPAKQMQSKGLDLGDNQTKLLQKIEELTLYVIDQQKQLEELKRENKEMGKTLAKIKGKQKK